MEVQTSSHEMPHEMPTYQTATWGWAESQNHFRQRVRQLREPCTPLPSAVPRVWAPLPSRLCSKCKSSDKENAVCRPWLAGTGHLGCLEVPGQAAGPPQKLMQPSGSRKPASPGSSGSFHPVPHTDSAPSRDTDFLLVLHQVQKQSLA